MESLGIPLIGGVTEHESLITSTHIFLVFGGVDTSSDVLVLSVNVKNNSASVGIESNIFRGESDISGNLSGNLLEVDLGAINRDFSKKNNLNLRTWC